MTDFDQRLKDTLSHTYDIERELGGAGMSRVYVATEKSLGRKVVIKVLSPELTADVSRSRFRREIQVAAQLQHPHIVPLLSAGVIEELLYYTMPFISGESLKSALEKNGPLPVVEVVRVLYHVAEALDYAHGQGVVHRDIKPANILKSGTYHLITDFGVAKALNAAMPEATMTSTGMAVGTPAYMAPEQLAGDSAADHRIDIYALGLLAYELLNGKSPFAASTPQRVLAAVLTQEPKLLIEARPDVPPSLSELVMRCLSKEPDKRPESAREVLDALDMFSTASGEIRTTEYRVPRSGRMTPTAVPVTTPIPEETVPVEVEAPVEEEVPAVASDIIPEEDEAPDATYDLPKKSRTRIYAGVVAFLIPVAAGAFLLSLRGDDEPSVVIPSSANVVAESVSVAVAAVAESVAAAPVVVTVDSQAIADSIRRAARREAAAKKAAANDSARKVSGPRETSIGSAGSAGSARSAAAAMVANPNAWKSFNRGATHMGGLFGAKRKGDLQTQIDALQPFLKDAGLTYEQFKASVQQSGIHLFDEFGRMIPDLLQQFASR